MQSDQFLPKNDLELSLIAAMAGLRPVPELMAQFLRSQVFVLLDKDPGPSAVWDNSSSPMVLINADGIPMLAVFTDPDRSTSYTGNNSKIGYGMQTDFRWLIRGVAQGVGIVVNPGSSVGMEVPPNGVVALREQATNPS